MSTAQQDLRRNVRGKKAAEAVEGLRSSLLRNWASLNLTAAQRETIRGLELPRLRVSSRPFVTLPRTIQHDRDSIEATTEMGLHQRHRQDNKLRRRPDPQNANGFDIPDAFIAMTMLDQGDLCFELKGRITTHDRRSRLS